MSNSQPKTTEQLRAIFGLGKKLNCAKEDLEEMAGMRLSLLSFDQANAMIVRLGGDAFPTPAGPAPRRTQNYRKQKQGIKTIVTAQQLDKLDRLWFRFDHRTPAGLEAISRRVNKGAARPRTTEECNRVIEAVKSMNERDGLSSRQPSAASGQKEPAFRRGA